MKHSAISGQQSAKWVCVILSMSNLDLKLKRAFEPRSPSIKDRLQPMEKLTSAGILVGIALMPIIPFVGDDEGHLNEAVRATKDHGGSFVLSGGLTMEGA
jgi:DNA repair photolyase